MTSTPGRDIFQEQGIPYEAGIFDFAVSNVSAVYSGTAAMHKGKRF
jgi:hypothetical protein